MPQFTADHACPRLHLALLVLLVLPFAAAERGARAASSTAAPISTVVIPVAGDPESVTVADVNHDGAPDIVAGNPNSGTVTVLLGDGKGHFHPAPGSPFLAGHLPNDIAVGDFNTDGNLDLIIANHQTPYVTLLLGDGKGGFRPAPHSPFVTGSHPHPHGVVVGHFCGKERPLDAVVDSWASDQVELLLGDGNGNLINGPMFAAGRGSDSPLGSADFDHDGAPDIVMPDTAIGHWDSNKVSVLLGDGKCGFHPTHGSPFPAGAVPWSVAVGDLNGDGNADLVIIPYGPKVQDPEKVAATILLGDGKGGFGAMRGSPLPLPECASPYRVAIGDVNGDRVPDFAVTCMQSDKILLFLGKAGGGYQLQSLELPNEGNSKGTSEHGIALADLTHNGRDDMIVTNGAAGTITIASFRSALKDARQPHGANHQ